MKSENVIPFEARAGETPSIKLSPEQIEEIHTDEYSLMLFYATRIEALSLEQIKRKFPEPEAKKAQSVLDRYIGCGLVHRTSDGKYLSNFPVDSYINYSDYRYDGTLETRKDQKIFEIMKEHASDKSYWRDRIYFSIDSFFSNEQSEELHAMFAEIRKKAKQFSAENKGKSVDKLRFRRLKFYDMFFMVALSLCLGLGFSKSASAEPRFLSMAKAVQCNQAVNFEAHVVLAGGNDPGMRAKAAVENDGWSCENIGFVNTSDPTPKSDDNGGGDKVDGGGHDPGGGGTHKEEIPLNRYPNQKRPEGGGHDPGGGGTTNAPGKTQGGIDKKIMDVEAQQCDWSKYDNLLSYPAEVVCSELNNIVIDEACLNELAEACNGLKR